LRHDCKRTRYRRCAGRRQGCCCTSLHRSSPWRHTRHHARTLDRTLPLPATYLHFSCLVVTRFCRSPIAHAPHPAAALSFLRHLPLLRYALATHRTRAYHGAPTCAYTRDTGGSTTRVAFPTTPHCALPHHPTCAGGRTPGFTTAAPTYTTAGGPSFFAPRATPAAHHTANSPWPPL